jgi:TonB family protein
MAAVVGISKSAVLSPRVADPRLQLLVQLEPAHRLFFSNLAEFFRHTPRAKSFGHSAPFWPDVFVSSPLPWFGFLESMLWHGVLLAALWVFSHAWLSRPHLGTRPVLDHSQVLYYSPSEYLQPIDTGSAPTPVAQKGQPELANQPIISVPAESDNRSQTIITPPDLKLAHEVPTPNMVAWNQAIPAAPFPSSSPSRRALPEPEITPVAPAPEVHEASGRRITAPRTVVVAPAPDLSGARTRQIPTSEVSIVAPPPSVEGELRKVGDVNIGPAAVAPTPQLPMSEQRTAAATTVGLAPGSVVPPPPSLAISTQSLRARMNGAGNESGQAVPPPPSIDSTATSAGGGRMIALGIHPSATPPPSGLQGNRRGTFAASPEGKTAASGTPELAAKTSVAQSAALGGNGGSDHGRSGFGKDPRSGLPAGIHVGSGPTDHVAAVRSDGKWLATIGSNGSFAPLVADSRPMRVTVTPHAATSSTPPLTELERSIFHDRKSFSMILNMPNLNSAGGSWIIRFAEKAVNDNSSNLTAPEATRKVDPGYPAELMRQNVQGTVILYAVIRSDGRVADVRVLSGVDDRLDQFARAALRRWEFKPAIRNGSAVDLDAVVTIPFRANHALR